MRFAVARQDGLSEDVAALVDTGFEDSTLSDRHKAVVRFTDALLDAGRPADADLVAAVRSELSDAEIAEVATGVAIYHGFSKLLIILGLEPDEMPTTVLPTPDVPS